MCASFSCIVSTVLLIVYQDELVHSFVQQCFLHVRRRLLAHGRCTKIAGQSECSVIGLLESAIYSSAISHCVSAACPILG